MIWNGKIYSRAIYNRNYVAKNIDFGVGARAAMLQGVSEVAEAVKVTMGPKVFKFILQFSAACFYRSFLNKFFYYGN